MRQITNMDHTEAVQLMATERYLLNELPPDLRDAYEEHLFDCPECALDLRAAEAFLSEAKIQLPELTTASIPAPTADSLRPKQEDKKSLLNWLRPFFANPVFAAPVFATLLVILGYQNLVTYPALEVAATQPRIVPWVSLHSATRGAAHIPVKAGKERGIMLLIDVAQQADSASYDFNLADAQGKSIWTGNIAADQASTHDGTLSLMIPGAELRRGAYTLTVFALNTANERSVIQRNILDVEVEK